MKSQSMWAAGQQEPFCDKTNTITTVVPYLNPFATSTALPLLNPWGCTKHHGSGLNMAGSGHPHMAKSRVSKQLFRSEKARAGLDGGSLRLAGEGEHGRFGSIPRPRGHSTTVHH